MWFFNLLTSASETASSDGSGSNVKTWPLLIVAVVMIGLMMFFNNRSQKKRQKEMEETLSAIKPGTKIKTIGGICGVVVEVDNEENTFVLETGSKKNKSYIKFDKVAVYQTDAKKEEPAKEEKAEQPAEELMEEPAAPVEEKTEE